MSDTASLGAGFEPGGLYDKSTVTFRDRVRCFATGHDVREWGTICGWCHRCKHSVWTYDRKSVLSYGEFLRGIPPAHRSGMCAHNSECARSRAGDGSVDFGDGFLLRPTSRGIRVEIDGKHRLSITLDELRPVLEAASRRLS